MKTFLTNYRFPLIILAGLLIAVTVLGVWQFSSEHGLSDLPAATDWVAGIGIDDDGSQATSTESGSGPPVYEKKFRVEDGQGGPSRFVSKEYDFSFQYPRKFSVSAFDDRGGHVVLVQTGDGETAVQMFITGWDEPTNAVTPDRIKKDLPDLRISNPRKMQMAGDGNALTFAGKSEKFGPTREVWFARSGNLYQIITPASGQDFLASLLETWQFE